MAVGSTDRRNTLGELLLWRLIEQGEFGLAVNGCYCLWRSVD